jgi:hypothetical protein
VENLHAPHAPAEERQAFALTHQPHAVLEVGHPHPALAVHAEALPDVARNGDALDDLERGVARAAPEHRHRSDRPETARVVFVDGDDGIAARLGQHDARPLPPVEAKETGD